MLRLYGGGAANGDRSGIAFGTFGANQKTIGATIFFEQQPMWPPRTGDLIFATKPINGDWGSVDPVNNERMRITWDGYTGIGTNAPKAKLHVNGVGRSDTSLTSGSRSWITYSNDIINRNTDIVSMDHVSIYSSAHILASGVIMSHSSSTFSDARIKKNIVDIDDVSALDTIRAIKPKRYDYVDTITSTSETVWGFIAQEVKSTLNYAVNLMEKSIPNIMCNAYYDLENNTIVLENFNTANLLRKEDGSLCSELNLKTWDNREIEINIESIVNASTLKIKTPLKYEDANGVLYSGKVPTTEQEAIAYEENKTVITNTIFVYGQTVNDFHVLKKDAIFTVAVAALQEIDRRQVEDNESLIALENEMTALRSENTQLINQLKDITARLTKAGI